MPGDGLPRSDIRPRPRSKPHSSAKVTSPTQKLSRQESAVTVSVRPLVTVGDRPGKHKIMPADSGNDMFTLKSAHYVFMEGVRGAAY